MSKRKKANSEEVQKKQKTDHEIILTSKSFKDKLPLPEADILNFLDKLKQYIPKDDTVGYNNRLDKIPWNEIAFKSYTPEQCKDLLALLIKPVRKFRLLDELVTDARVLLGTTSVTSHPDKPKQPLNSYMIFVNDKRQQVTKEHPNLSPCAVAKKLGEIYQNLPSYEKKKYEEKAKEAREVYDRKLQGFYEEHPECVPRKSSDGKKRKKVDKTEPAKPKKPYDLFVEETEKEQGPMAKLELQALWNSYNDEQKYFWIKWADELYVKYIEEVKEYIKTHPDYDPKPIKNFLTKKDIKIKEKCSGKPEKPPQAAYHLFTKMMMQSDELQNIDSKKLMSYISEKWNSCTEEEKSEYKTRVEQMWEEYDVKLEAYIQSLPPEDRDKVRSEEKRRKGKKEKVVEKNVEVKEQLSKPATPPVHEFDFFLKNFKGDSNEAEEIWDEMTEEEKEEWKKKLDNEKHVYIKEYEEYLMSLSKDELQKLGSRMYQESSSEEE